jgi:hypothetical protein
MKDFRLKPPKTLRLVENDVERQCLDALRYRQYRPERLHAGRFKSLDGRRYITAHPKGTPDYVVTHSLYPAFYMEVKRPGETTAPEQDIKHAELRLNGLTVVWVDGFEVLLRWVERHEGLSRDRWRAELES